MIKLNFKLPVLKGRLPTGARLGKLPAGSFICTIERCFPFEPRQGNPAIRVELTVKTIEKQDAYVNPDTGLSNECRVGDRRQEWFEMGGQYGYGEAEWSGFLRAVGATDDDIDQAQDAALSAENPLRGQDVRIIHTLQSKKDGGVFMKPSFESV